MIHEDADVGFKTALYGQVLELNACFSASPQLQVCDTRMQNGEFQAGKGAEVEAEELEMQNGMGIRRLKAEAHDGGDAEKSMRMG